MKNNLIKCKIIFFIILFNAVSVVWASEDKILSEIHSDQSLRELDARLNRYYNLLFKTLKLQDFTKLKIEQRKWLERRNEICLKQNYLPLLKKSYTERINYLKDRFKEVTQPIMDGLITDEEHIIREEKLKLIENCYLNICQAYRLCLKHDNEKIISRESYNNDREDLLKLAADVFGGKYSQFDLERFNSSLKEGASNTDLVLMLLSSRELYDEIEELKQWDVYNTQIPLWLVIKHPDIIKNMFERFDPSNINTKISIHYLPQFKKLAGLIDDMEYGHIYRGSIYRDIDAFIYNFKNLMSFAPKLDESRLSIKEKLAPLYDWSFEGIWNRKKYSEFLKTYDEAIIELREYYRTNYNLGTYVDKAEDLIASYINQRLHASAKYSKNPAYKLFSQPSIAQDELKIKSIDFNKEDWDIALSIAILNNYAPEVIDWIIKSGANVNSLFTHETPLMKAVEQPGILKILLKARANPNLATPYGKTPLFYAIQYNNLESIKLLLESKVNINASIKNKEDLEKLVDESGDYFLLEEVAKFTPLIYSLAYFSEEIIDLLIREGANLGELKIDNFKGWILRSTKIKEEKLNSILNLFNRNFI